MILAAGLSVACGEIKLQGPQVTEATAELDGHGTLKLTSEQFPEGAETLILSVVDVGGNFHKCAPVFTLPQAGPAKRVGEGLGLQTIAKPDWKQCVPVLEESHAAQQVVEGHVVGAGRVIQIKRGEEIAPIRLPAGSYEANADFSDKGGQPLYTGTEFFKIQVGEQKALTIRLKKIESGAVAVSFEVEKPEVLPRKISGNVRLELSLNLMEKYEKKMDLDLVKGTAVISARCIDDRKCKVAVNEKKVTLSRQSLMTINAIISAVQIKHTQKDTCVQPQEYITLLLKSCAECDSRKTHKFINFCFSPPYHTLTGVEFEKIWSTVNGAVSGSPQVAASK
jgi:hypothetical protein